MPIKSIFDPTAPQDELRGGLSDFLGPEAKSYSHLPETVTAEKVGADGPEQDCDGRDANSAVCQIKEALDERLHDRPAAPPAEKTDGPA